MIEDYPESTMSNGCIFVNWKGENIAFMNLKAKKVDCQDEYTMMRLQGIMDGLIAESEKIEEEEVFH